LGFLFWGPSLIHVAAEDTVTVDKETKETKLVADEYQIGKKLGAGSYGSVYDATSVKTGKNVAIKIEMVDTGHGKKLLLEYTRYQQLKGIGNAMMLMIMLMIMMMLCWAVMCCAVICDVYNYIL
jgi:hypothetical protein